MFTWHNYVYILVCNMHISYTKTCVNYAHNKHYAIIHMAHTFYALCKKKQLRKKLMGTTMIYWGAANMSNI